MPETTETYELGGRAVRIITNGNVRHDNYLYSILRDAELVTLSPQEGELIEPYIERVLDGLIAGGHSIRVLGALLAPADLDLRTWSPDVAHEMETFIEQLIEPADKQLIRSLTAQSIVLFFQSGIVSFKITPTASLLQEPKGGESDPASGA